MRARVNIFVYQEKQLLWQNKEKLIRLKDTFLTKWEAVANRFETLNHQFADPAIISQPSLLVSLNKERAEIEEAALLFSTYQSVLEEITNTRAMLEDSQP